MKRIESWAAAIDRMVLSGNQTTAMVGQILQMLALVLGTAGVMTAIALVTWIFGKVS